MPITPKLQLKQSQSLLMTPQLQQAIKLLQMSNIDLAAFVENELAEKFGSPDNNTAKYFLVAASFLKYGNALKVVRVASGHDNATADGSGQLIKNNDDYVNNYADGSLSKGNWVAKYPGELGNSLKVSMVTEGITSFSGWTYAANFDAAPGTSQYAIDQGKTAAKDEVHVAVVDEDGAISGTPGTVLETRFSVGLKTPAPLLAYQTTFPSP